MKNPLNKRYFRELKDDFGKYLVIFAFLVFFVGVMSGFFVTGSSVMKLYEESHEQLNLEDGHISFNIVPDHEVMEQLERENDLQFYSLNYKEETIVETGNKIRIYADRDTINLVSLYEGILPDADNEIAIDRMYADNNKLTIGDRITVNNKSFKITSTIALPDYSAMYENNNDMMFDAVNFGVAVLSKSGYEAFSSVHETINYAWKYNTTLTDDQQAYTKFEDFKDSLEEIIKKYDQNIVQGQVDELYDHAEELADTLKDKMKKAGDTITKKIKKAGKAAYVKMMMDPTQDMDTLIAKELGTSKKKYLNMIDALEDADKIMDDVQADANQSHTIDFDSLDNAEDYENDISFSLDGIRDIVKKVAATGIVNTKEISALLDEIETLKDFQIDESSILKVEDCLPEYLNQAINFVGTDGSSDRASAQVMTYLIMGIIAFMFAVTISNTINKEAMVIGTLRASGYTKSELIRHYMVLPIVITLLGCGIGNVLGYTVFVDMFQKVYYGSYSLPLFQPYFNMDAFVQTTVIPMILTIVINGIILTQKMRVKPLNFIRGDLSLRKSHSSVLRLSSRIPFLSRFRIRILLQNVSSYMVLTTGIIMAGLLAVFGFMFIPLIEDYGTLINETKLCEYQYVLMNEVETSSQQAEKFCLTTLETTFQDFLADDISVYGIADDSNYVLAEIPENKVLVSNPIAVKFQLNSGDELVIKDKYSDKTYTFEIAGIYTYDAALSVFMSRSEYLQLFNKDADYFTGYFSNEILQDIQSDDIATIIDSVSLAKVVNQMSASFGNFMVIFQILGGGIFMMLMYILTKQIIERNMKSISMSKILGFTNGEIGRLYLVITSIVVLAALLASVPIIDTGLRFIMSSYMYKRVSGYIPYIVSNLCYVKMILMGILCYAAVAAGMMIKIKRIPKGEVLRNQTL